MKGISYAITVLGICILIAGWLLSNAIRDGGTETHIPSSFSLVDYSEKDYELIVQDGWLYLYNKTNGQVYKKLDHEDSSWEEIPHHQW